MILEDITDDEEYEEDSKSDESELDLESEKTQEELSRLKSCLDRAKNSIAFLKERERKLKDR